MWQWEECHRHSQDWGVGRNGWISVTSGTSLHMLSAITRARRFVLLAGSMWMSKDNDPLGHVRSVRLVFVTLDSMHGVLVRSHRPLIPVFEAAYDQRHDDRQRGSLNLEPKRSQRDCNILQ